MTPISRLLTADDVAAALGFTPAKVRHLIRRGHLPTVAIGRRVYVPEADLANLTRPGESAILDAVAPTVARTLRFRPKD